MGATGIGIRRRKTAIAAAGLALLYGCGGGDTGGSQPTGGGARPKIPDPPASAPDPDPTPAPDLRPEAGWAGYFQVVALASGKCFDVEARATGNNAVLIQHDCEAGSPNQQF